MTPGLLPPLPSPPADTSRLAEYATWAVYFGFPPEQVAFAIVHSGTGMTAWQATAALVESLARREWAGTASREA